MRTLFFFLACFAGIIDAAANGWVSASTLYFKAGTEQQILHIETNLSWNLTKDQSWVSTSLGSGLYGQDIIVTCSPNTTSAARQAKIKIVEADNVEHTIIVLQQAPVLSISHQYQYLNGAEGSSSTFEIISNADWSITGVPSWFTVSQSSGTLTKSVDVTAVKNSGSTTRSAVLDITVVGVGTKQIKIAQLPDGENFTLNVSAPSIALAGNIADAVNFDITSNIGWTIQTSESWLKTVPSFGENNLSAQASADINPDPVARTANINITGQCSSTNSISKQIVVTQAGNPYIKLSSSNIEIDHHEVYNSLPLTITANSSWSASSSQSWASLSSLTGTGDGTVNVNVQSNPTNVSRTAVLTFTSTYGKTAAFTVTQLGAPSSLAVSSNAVKIGAIEASEVSVQVTANFTNWTVASSETWLTFDRLTNTPSSVVKLIAAANPGTAARTATITISGESIVRTIIVTQTEKTDRVTISTDTLKLYTQGVFSISADIAWTLNCVQPWLSGSPVSGSSNGTVTITALTNPTTNVRYGNVVVNSSEGIKSVVIKQEGAIANLFTDINTGKLYLGSSEGSSADVNISSNTSWTVESNQSWLNVSDANGFLNKKITLTASFNKSQISRTATVTIKCNGIIETIEVTQYGSSPFVQVNETSLEVGSSANSSKSFSIVSNTNWEVHSSEPWLTPSILTGTGDASIMLTATENTTLNYRTANVTITAGGISKVIEVSQSSNAVQLSVSATDLTIEDSMITFDITTNTDWHVGCSATWFYAITTSGNGNATVSVGATENTTGSTRTGTITVSVTGKSKIITITQPAPATLDISKTSLTYDSSSGSKSFDVSATSSWSISCTAEWITLNTTSGSGNRTITVTTSANTSGVQRTAEISVSDVNTTKTISVTQESFAYLLNVSESSLNIQNSEGSTASFNITSNISWTVSSSETWLSPNITSGNGNSTIQLSATANSTNVERSAIVTVTNGSIYRQITVVQPAFLSGTLTLSATQIEIGSISGSQATFTITSNTSWLVSCSDSWVTLTGNSGSGNGTVTITAGENYESSTRNSTLKVFYEGQLKSIILVQKATDMLEVSANSLQLSNSEGSTASFDITSNVNWTVSSAGSWLSIDVTSGNGNSTVHLTAEANTGSSERTTTLTVTNGSIQRQITVNQAPAGILSISSTNLEIGSSSGSNASFTITSNTLWMISCSDSWVTLSGTTGNGNGTVTLSANSNNGSSERTSVINIAYDGKVQTITLTQKAYEVFDVSVNSLQLANTAGSQESFNIISNASWTVTSSQPWLSVNLSSGNGNSTILISVTANPSTTERTATITVTNGIIQKQIAITQAADVQTGIKNEILDKIVIYPNPAREGFRIKGIEPGAMVTLIDMNGKCVLKRILNDDEYISISTLTNGTYILNIKMNAAIFEKRIIKK